MSQIPAPVLQMAEQALKNNESRFRHLFDNTDAISVQGYDKNRRVLYWNHASEELYGYTAEQAIGQKLEDLIIPNNMRNQVVATIENWLNKGVAIPSAELKLKKADGALVQVFSSHVLLHNQNDEPEMYCIDIDLTDVKQAEAKVHQGELVLNSIFQAIPDLFFLMDSDGHIQDYRAGQLNDLYIPPEEFLGKRMQDVLPPPQAKLFLKNMQQVKINGGMQTYEYSLDVPGGKSQFEARLSYLPDSQQFITVVRDITSRKCNETQILHQAHYDTLTDLPNRFLALDRLTQLLIKAQRNRELVAVLFLDLDDFKKINDSLGHETGDKVLVEAADRLLAVVRKDDTVGRLGGDEFIVLLGGLSEPRDVLPIAENLIERFRQSFKIDDRELILTMSVGISIFPGDGETPSELLRNADSAMYHAKSRGRDTYSYFTNAMNKEVSRRLAIEEQIRGALKRNEFEVHYQPQVNVVDQKMMGAEALLRWNNPVLGSVSPVEFIPIAEQSGIIIPIGQFVLKQALALSAQWKCQQKTNLRIAVNLSPSQFRDPGLVDFIKNSIRESGTEAKNLELEITEGVLMSGHSYIDESLEALADLGITLAMDDFGTGYSSLSYLRRYPFDILKIDRSFINEITLTQSDKELVNATIAMAHVLGIKVVAEGVETHEQNAVLKELGCDYSQGYLFGKPQPPEMLFNTDLLH